MSRWQRFNMEVYLCSDLPRVTGVYAIFSRGKLVYVGSSMDVSKRLTGHRVLASLKRAAYVSNGDPYDHGIVVAIRRRVGAREDYEELERELIWRLKPPMNNVFFRPVRLAVPEHIGILDYQAAVAGVVAVRRNQADRLNLERAA